MRIFEDRIDAGARLAARLETYRGNDVVALGIPRGGVIVAAEIARRLGADLDVVVARKVGTPGAPELALGAVTADGERFLNESIIREIGIPDAYLEAAIARETAEARRRESSLRADAPAPEMKGRVVIVVDDGLATGATARAALRSVRAKGPSQLIMAAPVGSRDACDALRQEADELVCLYQPEPFYAVGLYYQHFEATEDSDVRRILEEFSAARPRLRQPAA